LVSWFIIRLQKFANSIIAYEDAAQIKLLTKTDMIEFFNHYINTSSPARSKLAIHLKAQTPQTVIENGMETLAINKDEKDDEDGEVVPVKQEGNGTTPYIITDVREFKSKLQVSAGPQPVKHISEFEDLESKL
jgi:insulysin